jgi:hypothetical protein
MDLKVWVQRRHALILNNSDIANSDCTRSGMRGPSVILLLYQMKEAKISFK